MNAPCTFRLSFILFLAMLCFSMGQAQTATRISYPLKFRFTNSTGIQKDTMLSRQGFYYWSQADSAFPAYVRWKNQPFSVLRSGISGVGLFTDTASSFASGQTVGYAFTKVNTSGRFDLDYLETSIGSFINDSSTPNLTVSLTSTGILLQANQNVPPGTELTASYTAIINLFPNDKTVSRVIRYW